ncbi:PREDICTED: transcription factor MYB86-like [Lupinus angustifolius]|uniref:transcription factor MYB86-like n=1 Tax=Lupinus angustifolius TaxID=3871 RepID=UPI00092FA983|nr:PREDICTED: transcription factor MYB86-like [Lupinus angustifolius]
MSKEKVNRGIWKPYEEEILIAHVIEHGLKNIKNVTGLDRSERSCKRRWNKQLKQRMNLDPFTPEEVAKIIELHAKLGNNLTQIAEEIPGRSFEDIRNLCRSLDFQIKLTLSSQQQVYVSQAASNPDTTGQSSIPQVPSPTSITSQQGSNNSGVSGDASMLSLNEQVDSYSTDEDSLYGAAKRFLK